MECIDLFSGIGGMSLALSGIVKTTLYCEIDPFCQQVLAERMEDGLLEKAPIHSNVKTLHIGDYIKPKMICAGFPCQDISSMGLQKGIVESDRSSLFFEIMRIVDESPSIQYIFLENVANITKCGLKDVIKELVGRGFNMQWMLKSASSMGAPHCRNRWFCFAARCNLEIGDILSNVNSIPKEDWDVEHYPRVSFRPNASSTDVTYDNLWIQRCQALGNTVVPCVVRSAFLTLTKGCTQWTSIFNGLADFSVKYDTLDYPFPDCGIVVDGHFIILPKPNNECVTTVERHKTVIEFENKNIILSNLPTPRRGLTHASALTDRSLRDLPTVLVHCNESKEYIRSKGLVYDKDTITKLIISNVNYIEWMMGYPKDWTKVIKYKKSGNKAVSEDEDVEKQQTYSGAPTNVNTKPVNPDGKKRCKYNGMHVLMREMPGKDIRVVAEAWRNLSEVDRALYSKKAGDWKNT